MAQFEPESDQEVHAPETGDVLSKRRGSEAMKHIQAAALARPADALEDAAGPLSNT
jgi:hypothetical protein